MRTTVEISDEQRAQLAQLAARRGEKGFSSIVQEAIDLYLRQLSDAERKRRIKAALALAGSISENEAEEMRARIRDLRSRWR